MLWISHITMLKIFRIMLDMAYRSFIITGASLGAFSLLEILGLNGTGLLVFPFMLSTSGGSDSADSDGPGNGDKSTPFIYSWKNNKWVVENDILFGKPVSYFRTKEEGKYAYEHGGVTGDMYRIQTVPDTESGKLRFRIREIEPEESFFDSLNLVCATYPANSEIFVDSKFNKVFAFRKRALIGREGVQEMGILNMRNEDLTQELGSAPDSYVSVSEGGVGYELDIGDYITINAKVKDREKPLFLILGSLYRDWTLGEIFSEREQPYSISTLFQHKGFVAGTVKFISLLIIFGLTSIGAAIGSLVQSSPVRTVSKQDVRLLVNSFGAFPTHADVPTGDGPISGGCSLYVEYLDSSGLYRHFETVQPRYYKTNYEVVEIPPDAIVRGNYVTLRVLATKKHKIAHASLISTSEKASIETEELSLSSCVHNRDGEDYTEILSEPYSGVYMRTIPADVVDVEFELPQSAAPRTGFQNTYLIKASGYYVPATREVQQEAGDWISRLDPESRNWLRQMHDLNTYKRNNKRKVLS